MLVPREFVPGRKFHVDAKQDVPGNENVLVAKENEWNVHRSSQPQEKER